MDKLLGPQNVVLPQGLIELIYEQGAIVTGVYVLIARHSNARGRARVTRDQIREESKLGTAEADAAIDWLWENDFIKFYQTISPDGGIEDQFFYAYAQDRTGRGGD